MVVLLAVLGIDLFTARRHRDAVEHDGGAGVELEERYVVLERLGWSEDAGETDRSGRPHSAAITRRLKPTAASSVGAARHALPLFLRGPACIFSVTRHTPARASADRRSAAKRFRVEVRGFVGH